MIFNSSHYYSSEIKHCPSSDQQKKQKHVFLAYHKIPYKVTERFNHYTLVSPVSLFFRLIPLIFLFFFFLYILQMKFLLVFFTILSLALAQPVCAPLRPSSFLILIPFRIVPKSQG